MYVEDTARAFVLAMKNGTPGEAYNVGTVKSTDINTIFRTLKEEMGYQCEAYRAPNPLKSYQTFTLADIKKAREELKFVYEYDLRAGVREMLHNTD